MAYIGTKPADKPLTAADITDSIITSAKIVDGTIVNADINATSAITLNKLSGNPSFRNIVINGDMQIAQRSTSVASITTGGYYTLDRFQTFINGTLGTWTQSQSTDVPTGEGFSSSLKMDCTTADASPAVADFLIIQQSFEGQNLQYLKKGTASAVSLTASFWIKSTKTGTFICELLDTDNTRQISKSYTVNTTNTWEKKTITFAGDTTGAFTNDNGESLRLNFWLGAGTDFTSGTLNTSWGSTTSANRAVGQVNIADSTSNDWYITGVQLEAGTSATDFEFLPIDVDLARCQRYCNVFDTNNRYTLCNAYFNSTTSVLGGVVTYPTTMRADPTVTYGGTTANFVVARPTTSNASASAVGATTIRENSYELTATSASASTSGFPTTIFLFSDAKVTIDAEL
jgi:hypothetical protein